MKESATHPHEPPPGEVTEVTPGHFELHRLLPSSRMSRPDMQALLGALTEPEVAGGLLVHAGFHVRLEAGDVIGDSPDTIPPESLPPECSDVFLTVDFGDRERYQRQVLVVFEPDQAAVSITGNDPAWIGETASRIVEFVEERRPWFRYPGFLQRALLIAGMTLVTLAAAIGNFAGSEWRWPATWIFVTGVTVVAASALVPGQLRYSVISLTGTQPPGNSSRENTVLGIALAIFSIGVVGSGISSLIALTG
ncbi:MAG: hypothetical protein KC482_01030 [Dehalococcoidia bacterium]|nr:hypothetical protein [Dehalococcoidia bacterium]MCA9824400.1 hypothetical protein [Dehalococcoidia bacterium]MCA9852180.1 hypothetical protein [Dehalococcoidia bacterium]